MRALVIALAAAATALPAASAAAACPGADAPLTAASAGTAREAVLCLVNEERVSRGLSALERDAQLETAAQRHSEDMVQRDFFEHVDPDGRSPGDRIETAGYDWASCGENIAVGHRTPREVMSGWMDSPGHRANILSAQFTELGVGIALAAATIGGSGGTWTQNFGRPRGVPAPDQRAEEGTAEDEPGLPAEQAPGPEDVEELEDRPSPVVDDTAPPAAARRVGGQLVVAGRLPSGRVHVRVVQRGRTVARRRAPVTAGRYRVWIAVPRGPLTVVVRGGGRRAVHHIA